MISLLVSPMKMEGHYLQALYDFATTEACEINLAVGDIVKVVRQVDDNWLCGVLRNKVRISCRVSPKEIL